MRTLALRRCAPAGLRKLLRTNVLRRLDPARRCRTGRSGGGGSDPAGRGPAAGSGPGVFAHPSPLSLGSLPSSGPSGKAVQQRLSPLIRTLSKISLSPTRALAWYDLSGSSSRMCGSKSRMVVVAAACEFEPLSTVAHDARPAFFRFWYSRDSSRNSQSVKAAFTASRAWCGAGL